MYRRIILLITESVFVGLLLFLNPSVVLGYLSQKEAFSQSFDLVWSTINESHWDESFGGLDWEKVRKEYRPKLRRIKNRTELVILLQQMLNELELSHFRILSSSVRAMDNFPRGGYVGLDLKYTNGQAYVTRVVSNSPSAEAGIEVGWRLKSIHRKSVKRLVGPFLKRKMSDTDKDFYIDRYLNEIIQGGTKRRVRTDWYPPGKRAVKVYITPKIDLRELSDPVGYLPSQRIEYEDTYLEGGVLYIRFNAFVPILMADIRESIESAEGKASGIIIDLRFNLGGLSIMASGITGLLVDKPTNLGKLAMKKGHITYQGYPQAKRFNGPVAILVDGGSASTSEILAAGLQEAERARVFGETTLGDSLPSLFMKLPSGDVLQYAVGDYTTPGGYRIEKNGVVPDVLVVPTTEDLEKGRDLPLQEATKWIINQTQSEDDAA